MANKKIEYLHGEISPWLKEQIRNAAFDAHMTMGQWLNKILHEQFYSETEAPLEKKKPGPKPGKGGKRAGAGRKPSLPVSVLAQAGWTLDISEEGLPVLKNMGVEVFKVKKSGE